MKFVLLYFWMGGWSFTGHYDRIAVFDKKEDCEIVKAGYLKSYANANFICTEETAVKK